MNSDQENTAENAMLKAVGCVAAIGGIVVLLIVGVVVLIGKSL